MVSDFSKKSIEKHLEHCADCKETFGNMSFGLEPDEKPPEGLEVKKFLRKTKKMYFFYGLGGISFVAAFVCFLLFR